MTTDADWRSSPWIPPLDPPVSGALPDEFAEAIANLWWDEDPFYACGLMWRAYAGTQPMVPAVTSVSTGVQSVAYAQPTTMGPFGEASAKADWFFAHSGHGSGGLVSIQLSRPELPEGDFPWDVWIVDP